MTGRSWFRPLAHGWRLPIDRGHIVRSYLVFRRVRFVYDRTTWPGHSRALRVLSGHWRVTLERWEPES